MVNSPNPYESPSSDTHAAVPLSIIQVTVVFVTLTLAALFAVVALSFPYYVYVEFENIDARQFLVDAVEVLAVVALSLGFALIGIGKLRRSRRGRIYGFAVLVAAICLVALAVVLAMTTSAEL